MTRSIAGFSAAAVFWLTASLLAQTVPAGQTGHAAPPLKPGLTLSTTAFEDGGIVPVKYTQAAGPGKWVSPQLTWNNVPDGTVSFALIVYVPDQPMNHGTDKPTHWLIFNIPGTATGLPEGVPLVAHLPDGSMQLKNMPHDAPGFLGPGGSPAGPYHHYTFELFALDTMLTLAPDAGRADLENAMESHILGIGVLVGRFHRP